MSIFSVFETWGGGDFVGRTTEPLGDAYFTSTMALYDATKALEGAKSAGQPLGTSIYFAVDYDCTDPNVLTEYFKTVYGILKGKYRVGVYGSYRVTRFAGQNWLFVPDRWQTYAWSGGLIDGGALLYQYSNGVIVNGAVCDLDESSIPGWTLEQYVTKTEFDAYKQNVKETLDAMKAVYNQATVQAFHHKHPFSGLTTNGETGEPNGTGTTAATTI